MSWIGPKYLYTIRLEAHVKRAVKMRNKIRNQTVTSELELVTCVSDLSTPFTLGLLLTKCSPGIGRLTIDLERLKDSDMCMKHTMPCMNVMASQCQIARLLPGLEPCFWSRCWISRGLSLALHYKEATESLEQPEPELSATLVPLSPFPLSSVKQTNFEASMSCVHCTLTIV